MNYSYTQAHTCINTHVYPHISKLKQLQNNRNMIQPNKIKKNKATLILITQRRRKKLNKNTTETATHTTFISKASVLSKSRQKKF